MTEQEPTELDKRLSACFEIESNRIQRQQDKLKEKYETLPDLIKSTSQLTGIDAEQIVTLAYKVACAKDNVNIYDVIDVLYLFHAYKEHDEYEKSVEKEQKGHTA